MKEFFVLVCSLVVVPAWTLVLQPAHCPPPPECARPPPGCHYVPGANGCYECNLVCARAACPPVCDIFCLSGNVLDDNGCPTCSCKQAPSPTTQDIPFLECHTWMKCAQGVCPYTCGCQPNC